MFLGYLKRLVASDRAPLSSDQNTQAPELPYQNHPGHLIRRFRQICDGIFLQLADPFGITPVQFSTLAIARNHPEVDNTRLASLAALDQATMSVILRRLAAKDWIDIRTNDADRRAKSLRVTPGAKRLLDKMQPVVIAIEARTMRPLTRMEAANFVAMLLEILECNNENSRAPYRDLSSL